MIKRPTSTIPNTKMSKMIDTIAISKATAPRRGRARNPQHGNPSFRRVRL
jgi:hypothetical protein